MSFLSEVSNELQAVMLAFCQETYEWGKCNYSYQTQDSSRAVNISFHRDTIIVVNPTDIGGLV